MTLLRPLLMLLLLALSAAAQDLSALAKVNPLRSGIVALADGGLELKVALSQPVPWRLRLMDNPPRLVIDAREIDWRGVEALAVVRPGVSLRAGAFRPGWSRLVMELAGPLKVERAAMVTGDDPRIELVLAPTDAASFAREAARPDLPDWALPEAAELPPPRKEGSGPLVVVTSAICTGLGYRPAATRPATCAMSETRYAPTWSAIARNRAQSTTRE